MRVRITVVIMALALIAAALPFSARAADRPLAGIAAIGSNSPRSVALTPFLEESLVRVIDSTALFRPVNPSLLREELTKFGCTDEGCLLRFARDAGLSIIIRGDIDDQNDFVILTLTAYGIDLPYQNRIVHHAAMRIPLRGRYTGTEYGLIMEEHAGIFFARFLSRFQAPLYMTAASDGRLTIPRAESGWFLAYRPGTERKGPSLGGFEKIGRVRLSGGTVTGGDAQVREGDFILAGFSRSARYLDRITYERKHEMVFRKSTALDSLYAVLLTGPASASMPLIAPFVGYYRSNDWSGATIWAFNAAPYLYLEINGIANYFANYHKKKKSVPRDVRAQYYYGFYFMCAGGAALFADSFAYTMMARAADHQGVQPLLGNSFTAGYLALVSGGAGHFYRGQRLWGYLYFHADNLLLYFTIREFCPERRFDPLTRSFSTARVSTSRAYTLLSIACAVKVGEIVHAVLARDAIRSGTIIEEGYSMEPVIYGGAGSDPIWGIQCAWRF